MVWVTVSAVFYTREFSSISAWRHLRVSQFVGVVLDLFLLAKVRGHRLRRYEAFGCLRSMAWMAEFGVDFVHSLINGPVCGLNIKVIKKEENFTDYHSATLWPIPYDSGWFSRMDIRLLPTV